MDKKRLQSNMLLLLTALIWGTAFVAQSMATGTMGAFSFNAARSYVAGIALLPVIFFISRARKKRGEEPPEKAPGGMKTLITGGVACGVALAAAAALQQIGIAYTTTAKAGFLTALYIILVPILGIFLRRRAHFTVWISVAMAAAGLYLLCIKDGFSIEYGDLLEIACALGYSIHIMVIDHFSPKVDCVKMSCIQFFVCATISLAVGLIFDNPKPQLNMLVIAWFPILYTGVMSSGVGYTLQMIAQKNTSPAVASLLMSLESVFAALAGWVILGQSLTLREFLGCLIMFAAIILAQTPDFIAGRKKAKTQAD